MYYRQTELSEMQFMFMYFFPLSTYSCGQKFTYTLYGYEYHGNLFWLFNDLFELFYFWGVMII